MVVILLFDNSTIAHNAANDQGGGIENNLGNGVTKINSSTIAYNTAVFNGGGIQCNNLILKQSQVAYNIAGNVGGGIFAGTAEILDSNISNNQANILGGGINISGNLTLRDSTLNHNTLVSTRIGGCIGSAFTVGLTGGNLLIDRSLFSYNTSSCPGEGTIFEIGSDNVILTNSVFSNNVTSNKNSQAIVFFARGLDNATVSNNTFIGQSGEKFLQIELYDHIYFMNNIFESNLNQVLYFEKRCDVLS